MLGQVPVETIDREVQLAVGKPFDAKCGFVERPVAGFRRRLAPGQPLRLVEPEALGIGINEIV